MQQKMKKFDSFKELNDFMKDTFNAQRSVLKHEPSPGEINKQPSMTVPDQTMSLSTLLEKFAKGEPLAQKTPIYNPLDTLPDLRTLDLAELEQLQKQNAAYIAELEQNERSGASTKPAVIPTTPENPN